MIFNRPIWLLPALIFGVTACTSDSNESTTGLVVHFAETHNEETHKQHIAQKHEGELHLPGEEQGSAGAGGAAGESGSAGSAGAGGAAGAAGSAGADHSQESMLPCPEPVQAAIPQGTPITPKHAIACGVNPDAAFAPVTGGHEAAGGTSGSAENTTATSSPSTTSAKAAKGGYDHDKLDHHHAHDKNGVSVSLYRIYAVIDHLELVQCTSVAKVLRDWGNGLLATAEAHPGHGAEPVGGRALDKPNVIDLLTQDEFILPLGDVSVAPGRYCGVRIGLTRLASDAYGKPTIEAASTDDPTTNPGRPDLNGKSFWLRADYCSSVDPADGKTCTARSKADLDDSGLTVPSIVTLPISKPLELNSNQREGFITVALSYGGWFDDVDVTKLQSDPAERQKLLNAVVSSFHVHASGLGELPHN